MALAPPGPLEDCDRNTIELALGKPRSAFAGVELYPTLAAKSAALLYGFAKSQACRDGNKRVALLLVVAFVRANGATLDLRPLDLADMILSVAASDPDDHDIVIVSTEEWLAERLREEEL